MGTIMQEDEGFPPAIPAAMLPFLPLSMALFIVVVVLSFVSCSEIRYMAGGKTTRATLLSVRVYQDPESGREWARVRYSYDDAGSAHTGEGSIFMPPTPAVGDLVFIDYLPGEDFSSTLSDNRSPAVVIVLGIVTALFALSGWRLVVSIQRDIRTSHSPRPIIRLMSPLEREIEQCGHPVDRPPDEPFVVKRREAESPSSDTRRSQP